MDKYIIKIFEGNDIYYYSLKSYPFTFKVPSEEMADRLKEETARTMSKYMTKIQRQLKKR